MNLEKQNKTEGSGNKNYNYIDHNNSNIDNWSTNNSKSSSNNSNNNGRREGCLTTTEKKEATSLDRSLVGRKKISLPKRTIQEEL